MFLELIAVFVAGFAGAGGMLVVARLARGRLPRWLVPLAAGGAMFVAAITLEYGWAGRTMASLPEGMIVAQSVDSSAPWRPWTYLVPMTDRFVAVDTRALRTNANDPALLMADLYFFGRWRPVQSVEVMVDCTTNRRADPALGDGSAPLWRDAGADDPVVSTVCAAR